MCSLRRVHSSCLGDVKNIDFLFALAPDSGCVTLRKTVKGQTATLDDQVSYVQGAETTKSVRRKLWIQLALWKRSAAISRVWFNQSASKAPSCNLQLFHFACYFSDCPPEWSKRCRSALCCGPACRNRGAFWECLRINAAWLGVHRCPAESSWWLSDSPNPPPLYLRLLINKPDTSSQLHNFSSWLFKQKSLCCLHEKSPTVRETHR